MSASGRRSSRFLPGSTFSTANPRKSSGQPLLSEYRGVEAILERNPQPHLKDRLPSTTSSVDEVFTAGAAAQRRSGSIVGNTVKYNTQASPDPARRKRTVLGSVEDVEKDGCSEKSESRVEMKPLTPSKRPHDASDSGDSPDELQGEVTTHPPPKHLTEKHLRKRQKQVEEIVTISPSRKRSPSDITTTQFMSSRKTKKPKRGHPDQGSLPLSILSVRFGPIHQAFEEGDEGALDLYPDKIVLGEEITRGRSEEVLLRHVDSTWRAENSMKVRLRLRQYSEAWGVNVDIEFATTNSKNTLLSQLRQTGCKIFDKEP